MTDKKWIVRNYRPGDEFGILKLREKVWGHLDLEREKLSLDFWRWQFLENPAGKGLIQVADDDGNIVGMQPLMPIDFLMDGQRVKVAMSVDTMTDPGYQKQGIFTTLSKAVYQEAAQYSIDIVWGFPNDVSRPGFLKKLGWFDITILPVYTKILKTERLLTKYLGASLPVHWISAGMDRACKRLFFKRLLDALNVSIREINQFDDRFDDLWRQHGNQHKIIQIRDSRFLQWRYFQIPLRKYRVFTAERSGQLICYMVTREMDLFGVRAGVIVDLFPIHTDRSVGDLLLEWTIQIFFQEDIDLIVLMIPSQYRYALRGWRFMRIPNFMNLKKWYLGMKYSGSRFSKQFLTNTDNWFLTFGDTDIA